MYTFGPTDTKKFGTVHLLLHFAQNKTDAMIMSKVANMTVV